MIKNFRLYGYQIAKGTKGTGWMSVSDSDLKELIKKLRSVQPINKDEILELFDEDTEGWFETNQWEYEVQSKIFENLGISQLVEDKISDYQDLILEYTIGYERYIIEQLKKNYPQEYKELFD